MLVLMQKLNQSKIVDIVGIFIVIFIAYSSGYLFNNLANIEMFAHDNWANYVPFGIISVVSSSLSIISTRLTSRLNKFGNVVGTVNTLISGTIDFLLGNSGAVLTYPVSFLINAASVGGWMHYGDKKVNHVLEFKKLFCAMLIGAIALSFGLNYLAFQSTNPLFWLSSTVFALSLIPNIMNIFKIEDQWLFWIVYNIVQLAKALTQGNFANVGKYVYYIVNSSVAYPVWRAKRQNSKVS